MGFKNFYLGYASALAVIMFVVSLSFTLVLLRRGGELLGSEEATS